MKLLNSELQYGGSGLKLLDNFMLLQPFKTGLTLVSVLMMLVCTSVECLGGSMMSQMDDNLALLCPLSAAPETGTRTRTMVTTSVTHNTGLLVFITLIVVKQSYFSHLIKICTYIQFHKHKQLMFKIHFQRAAISILRVYFILSEK